MHWDALILSLIDFSDHLPYKEDFYIIDKKCMGARRGQQAGGYSTRALLLKNWRTFTEILGGPTQRQRNKIQGL